MLKCESCGKAAPKNTEITETGVKTVYRLVSNPRTGKAVLVTSEVEYSTENEHCMLWLCSCGTENDIAADMSECSFDPGQPTQRAQLPTGLTEDDRSLITNGLRIAVEKYQENAKVLGTDPLMLRLAQQFDRQVEQTNALIAKLEE